MNDESVPTLIYPNVQIFIFLPTSMHVIHLLNSIRKYVLHILIWKTVFTVNYRQTCLMFWPQSKWSTILNTHSFMTQRLNYLHFATTKWLGPIWYVIFHHNHKTFWRVHRPRKFHVALKMSAKNWSTMLLNNSMLKMNSMFAHWCQHFVIFSVTKHKKISILILESQSSLITIYGGN